MKKILLVVLTTILLGTVGNAQETPKITYYTADSLTSGSVKNLFTGFFQLAFDNLTGKNRSFNFSSNPYALLLKNEPNLAIDSNYAKYTRLRRLNFNFGINVDSNWHFNGFQSGVKFKIIDQRDSSISKALWNKIKNDSLQTDGRELGLALTIYIRNREQV